MAQESHAKQSKSGELFAVLARLVVVSAATCRPCRMVVTLRIPSKAYDSWDEGAWVGAML